MTPTSLAASACLAVVSSGIAAPPGHSLVTPAHVVAPSASPPSLPDTPAGRCVAAYTEAMNSGRDDRMEAFERQYRSAPALARRPMADRLTQAGELRAEWGRLTLREVVAETPGTITVLLDAANPGAPFEFSFEFNPAEPGKIDAIMIRGPIEPDAPSTPLDAETRRAAVGHLTEALEDTYVFPDKAAAMAGALRAALDAGAYNGLATDRAFAERLTADLRAVCPDKHLSVIAAANAPDRPQPRAADPFHGAAATNYGFKKVELLPGNVGYIRFDLFHPGPEAERAAAAALAFVAGCDALVFDLRHNGGGSPEMIRFISSYLFDAPTHLNSFYDRMGNKTEEFWTLEEIPGRRFRTDLPVYVLTSTSTFSGAEEFSYNLKSLARATIVGETTGGGAHLVQGVRLGDRFLARIPYARAENPITKTNWEGVGVKPDVETTASEALDRAVEEIRAARAGARKGR